MEQLGAVLVSTTKAWANSDAVNTEKTVDLPAAEVGQPGRLDRVRITIRNPSAVTAIGVTAKVGYVDPVDGTTTRYAKLTSFTAAVVGTAPDDGGESFVVEGLTLGKGARLSLKNLTALGGADAFTASIEVRRAA